MNGDRFRLTTRQVVFAAISAVIALLIVSGVFWLIRGYLMPAPGLVSLVVSGFVGAVLAYWSEWRNEVKR